jgi:hypothetical protein
MCSYGERTLMGAEVSMTSVLVPDLLKVMEAAGVLRVGRTTAYDLVGKLPDLIDIALSQICEREAGSSHLPIPTTCRRSLRRRDPTRRSAGVRITSCSAV